jgi:biopolymer transport protein ExbB
MEEQPRNEPFSKIALDAAQAAAHHQRSEGSAGTGVGETLSRSEFVDRALRQAVTRESSKLQSGMTLLATVGATAPFVGLLGTVWGIYGALIRIGATGQASIDAVAGPVGEALIMTAIGLFVAIPAVFAYNFFSKINSSTIAKFDTFAHDLHDFFATGSRVR